VAGADGTGVAAPGIAAASGPGGAALAGLARRLGAVIYEALLLVAIIFVTGFIALPLVTPGHAGDAGSLAIPDTAHRVVMFCILFGVVAWYCVASWSGGRCTLPMKTWRLALVTDRGVAISRKTALLRFLCACIGPALALAGYAALRPHGLGAQALWLFGLNYLWATVDPDRQFLHDRLAGTRIVVRTA
jgi:uncharacterized RDD family membrane protein YckC